jgi:hypothetical protein
MDRNEEILAFVNNALKDNESISTEDVMNTLDVTKQEIISTLYTKGGYCITGALTSYGSISKLGK